MYRHFPGEGRWVGPYPFPDFYIRIRLKAPLRDDYYKYIYSYKYMKIQPVVFFMCKQHADYCSCCS